MKNCRSPRQIGGDHQPPEQVGHAVLATGRARPAGALGRSNSVVLRRRRPTLRTGRRVLEPAVRVGDGVAVQVVDEVEASGGGVRLAGGGGHLRRRECPGSAAPPGVARVAWRGDRTPRRPSVLVAARRVALSAAVVATAVVATAAPASAAEGLGEEALRPGFPLDMFLLVGIPVLVFAVVIALVYGLSDEPRLREGQSWWTEPDYNTRESLRRPGPQRRSGRRPAPHHRRRRHRCQLVTVSPRASGRGSSGPSSRPNAPAA